MRKRSVKVKITLWYLLLMGLMAGLMLVFLRLISGSVYTQSAMEQLDQTVRENLGQVTLVDGRPQMGEGFQFYENGVYTLVYSQDKTLLAGQVPVAFTAAEPFHNGLTRLVDTDTGQYYVLDFWVPAGWEEGLWVRGLLEVPAGAQSMPALLWVAAVSLPLFLLLAAVGGTGSPDGPSGPWNTSPPPPTPSARPPICPPGWRCLQAATSSAGWLPPSTRCLPGWSSPSRPRPSSPPTPPMSCGPPYP